MESAIGGCDIIDIVYRSRRTTVYRGVRREDHRPVAIKTLTDRYPRPGDLAVLRREFRVARQLRGPGIIDVLGLAPWENNLALIEEDFGGTSLTLGALPGLADFLAVALASTRALARVHEQIIHGDVSPSNIVWSPKGCQVRLIDFAAAIPLDSEGRRPLWDELSESSFPYMSPERTGRTQREVDHRTDLYSLGATFYHLLTGAPPFEARDRGEWIDLHLTREPIPPREIAPAVPAVVSDIVVRLLAKNPEDRYQSARGLLRDLDECRRRFEASGTIAPFPLGAGDVGARLQIPSRLRGRDGEIDQLLEALADARGGAARLAIVAGEPGVGKTALVDELRRRLPGLGGTFIEGKFDQFRLDSPYAAVAQALRQLVVHMLSQPEETLAARRAELRDALAPNARLMTDLVPELERVIGPQPAVPAGNPVEEQNRFHATLGTLLRTAARLERPLVLFLDDLHWSDAPTLALVDALLADRAAGWLLIVGTYRKSEVGPDHPLPRLLASMTGERRLTLIDLPPLDVGAIGELVGDALAAPPERTAGLAQLLHESTGGNPLSVRELIGVANRDGVIWFDPVARRWDWAIERLQQARTGEDLVELLLERLRGLPAATQRWLGIGACLGAVFDLRGLALAGDGPMSVVAAALADAVRERLLRPLGPDEYQPAGRDADGGGPALEAGAVEAYYRFQHDRVQQAAYALIPEAERGALHLAIARRLLDGLPAVEREERLVELARHLNVGAALLEGDADRRMAVEINLAAARKARATAAHAAALELLGAARALLPADAWQTTFDVAYEVHFLGSACAYMLGKADVGECWARTVLEHARTPNEKARVYGMQLTHLTFCDRMEDAVAAGLRGLRLLGVRLSARPSAAHILRELALAKLALGRRRIADLENGPVVDDPSVRLCMRILVDFIPPAYLTGNDKLFAAAVLRQVRLSLKHGVCVESAAAYASYVVLLAGLGDLTSANEFGKLALRLTERFNAVEWRCRNLVLYTLFGQSWARPWREMVPNFQEAVRAGLASGDLLFMAYTCGWVHLWDPDVDVKTAAEEGRKYLDIIEKTEYQNARDAAQLAQQTWANLLGETRDPLSLSDGTFDEDASRERMQRVRNVSGLGIHALCRLKLCLLYGEEEQGFAIIQSSRPFIRALAGSPYLVEYCLTAFLISATVAGGARPRPAARREMRRQHARMRRWAAYAPANFGQHLLLMDAERAALAGDVDRAASLFERAIAAAREGQFAPYEALANERAARFFAARGLGRVAGVYANEARYHYARWGAVRKVQLLDRVVQGLPPDSNPNVAPGRSDEASPGRAPAAAAESGEPGSLDVETMWRASQALSEEVILEKLMGRLVTSVRESAGATRVCLLLREHAGPELLVQADIRSGRPAEVMQRTPVAAADLPIGMIRYVLRTGESFVTADAMRHRELGNDPYTRGHGTRSMLAMPVVHRGEPLGVLYLENDVTTHAFDPQRVATLRILASQAAISLQNARLYEHIQRMADSFSRFVPREFLRSLGRSQLVDIELGESVQKVMTVLFSDMRGFTSLVERMSPTENIGFVNDYIARMEPAIRGEGGFIDSYIGDAIMALFDVPPAGAVRAGVAMYRALEQFNLQRAAMGERRIEIGVGINTGLLTLGTIGGAERLKCGVIGDAVNLAARLEGLTKRYRVPLLISGRTRQSLPPELLAATRLVDRVRVAGHSERIDLYEVFEADPPWAREGKSAIAARWDEALALYYDRHFADASRAFAELRMTPALQHDGPAELFEARARRYASELPGADWTGVEVFSEK
ncbi:MAG TPA: AAA family ATPase [Polyangia bacterium]|nr:AAA family ATPase [Polyangia bacterium]